MEGGSLTADSEITVSVRVHPGAMREAVTLLPDGSLDVRLRARAVEGQANAGLIDALAARLGLRAIALLLSFPLRLVMGGAENQDQSETGPLHAC